jgi:hypothetical protein
VVKYEHTFEENGDNPSVRNRRFLTAPLTQGSLWGAEEDGERGEGMKTVQILRALLKVAEFFGEVQQVHLYDGGLITIDGAGYQLQFLRK